MKTEWDYTELAKAYVKRADYAPQALQAMLSIAGIKAGDRVCDVGAGAAHLTRPLADRGLRVDAVEPNDAMRAQGIERTRECAGVRWFEGVGEATGRESNSYSLVTFGSSFNVVDRAAALRESVRLLVANGWFACMWNHRDLDDPLQARIEALIRERVPGYGLGTRREDQTAVIDASQLFGPVVRIEGTVLYTQSREECVEAWRSHATLARQAGAAFSEVVAAIDDLLRSKAVDTLRVPYFTRIWIAPKLA